ncbi:MAG: tRNA uridine-5-carboxymethylaminomethyl(34) synthesis GTPase MnmE [Clostridiales bacterium]|nr:tRNA uridine-5-carboxymethylaminomethyl(34) synthesis GTPase MnmE [Clostridiales bacterium]
MSTIAAISTPNAAGGIGVIRISGDGAIEIADSVFCSVSGKKLRDLKGYTAAFGYIFDGDKKIDEGVALVFHAPKSYTGENVVELSCHGGLYVTELVLRTVLKNGAEPAEAGEFTKRAFLNGKIDLAEAESVMSVISAKGRQALDAALNTLEGKLSGRISKITERLTSVSAAIAVWTDNPDEDIEEAHEDNVKTVIEDAVRALRQLIAEFDNGKAITEGIETVICGHPNVGKSTLMNLLSGCERSIVTPIAGTTRDIVEETVRLGDIVLRLADTAGIRESSDRIEAIGIDRAYERIDRAQLVLAVFDGSEPLTEEDRELLSRCRDKLALAIVNKTDLPKRLDEAEIKEYIPIVISVSSLKAQGTEEIQTALAEILGTNEIDSSGGMLASERQRLCCENALDSLKEGLEALESGMTLDAVNVSVDYAVEKLLELTGEKARDAVVGEVFSKFCVGK